MSATIHLSRSGAHVAFRPTSFLGGELFERYRRAVDVATFDRKTRSYLASTDRVHTLITRLRDAGFGVDVDADVHHECLKFEAVRWNDLQAAQDRIAHIDEEIQARSKGTERMFPHQATGALWLTLRRRALLADEQGTGKSLTAIVAIPAASPILIACPATLKGTWVAELRRRPQIKVTVVNQKKDMRWPEPGEAVIVSYDSLPKVHGKRADGSECDGYLPAEKCKGCLKIDNGYKVVVKEGTHTPSCNAVNNFLPDRYPCPGCHPCLTRLAPRTVFLCDEAHLLRNGRTARCMNAKGIGRAVLARDGRVWLATGTPIVNGPPELWTLLSVADLTKEAFGTYDEFARIFNGTENRWGGRDWGDASDEIVERMQRIALRRMRRHVLASLPPKMYRSIPVEVDRSTLKECEDFLHEQGKSVEEVAALLAQEKFPFKLMSRIRSALASAKIPAMLERVEHYEEQEEPLIVFSAHRAPIDKLATRKGWVTITGDTPQKDRQGIIERFQRGEYKGIGITIAAGGFGITLTRSHHVLFVDRDFTPAANAQAEDRACRIGQDHGVLVETLIGNHPLDERTTEILIEKTRLISAAVDAAATQEDVGGKAFEDELKMIQEEIALGRKVRRQAESDEERRAFRTLCDSEFHPKDEALALKLAEHASLIGLSDKQWTLAIDLARRAGRRRANVWRKKKGVSDERNEDERETA